MAAFRVEVGAEQLLTRFKVLGLQDISRVSINSQNTSQQLVLSSASYSPCRFVPGLRTSPTSCANGAMQLETIQSRNMTSNVFFLGGSWL